MTKNLNSQPQKANRVRVCLSATETKQVKTKTHEHRAEVGGPGAPGLAAAPPCTPHPQLLGEGLRGEAPAALGPPHPPGFPPTPGPSPAPPPRLAKCASGASELPTKGGPLTALVPFLSGAQTR